MIKLATLPNFSFASAKQRARRRRYLANLWAGIADGAAMHAHYAYLSSLSKPDLARLGLTREDVTRIVARGRR